MRYIYEFIQLGGGRTVIALFAIATAGTIAVMDIGSRPAFFDLGKIVLGGYLGQLVPGHPSRNRDKQCPSPGDS